MKTTYKNHEYKIDYDYTAATEGSKYDNSGDPGDPPSPEEIYINSVLCLKTGRELRKLPEKMTDKFEQEISDYEKGKSEKSDYDRDE